MGNMHFLCCFVREWIFYFDLSQCTCLQDSLLLLPMLLFVLNVVVVVNVFISKNHVNVVVVVVVAAAAVNVVVVAAWIYIGKLIQYLTP